VLDQYGNIVYKMCRRTLPHVKAAHNRSAHKQLTGKHSRQAAAHVQHMLVITAKTESVLYIHCWLRWKMKVGT